MADLDDKTERPAVPRKSDQLFRSDLRDWMNNACLNVMGSGDAYAYKAGYRRGAEVLIGYVGEIARDQDFLVYPIIFLYRHHIELMLKGDFLFSSRLQTRKNRNQSPPRISDRRDSVTGL